MTVDELKAIAARAQAASIDVPLLVAEVHRLQAREVELMQRALSAECLAADIGKRARQAEQAADDWRLRWIRAQDQLHRWFNVALAGGSR